MPLRSLEIQVKTINIPDDCNLFDPTSFDKRFEELASFLSSHPGSTIVYVALKDEAKKYARCLQTFGLSVAAFHGGLDTETKQQVQEDFMASKVRIVLATTAFGMGIDKPDVRNVIHWYLPGTLEEYTQQIGRSGIDGEGSHCMFFLTPESLYLGDMFARGSLPSRWSLRNLIFDIFSKAQAVPLGRSFRVSHWLQGKAFDVRTSPLASIYARLELKFGFFRATRSANPTFKFEITPSYMSMVEYDLSVWERAIFGLAKRKKNGRYHLNIDLLQSMHEDGDSNLHEGGYDSRYTVIKEVPQTEGEKEEVVDDIHQYLVDQEKLALESFREILGLLTGDKCLSLSLAEHFNMGLPDGKTKCGHCTHCLTGKPVEPPSRSVAETTASSIEEVLDRTSIRDDPRLLARLGKGIRSPRLHSENLVRDSVFRSLVDHNFEALLKACGSSGKL